MQEHTEGSAGEVSAACMPVRLPLLHVAVTVAAAVCSKLALAGANVLRLLASSSQHINKYVEREVRGWVTLMGKGGRLRWSGD